MNRSGSIGFRPLAWCAHAALPLVALTLLARPAAAQTHAVLLKKAIFLEETTGDLDAAAGVYRELLARGDVAGDVRREASNRLSDIARRREAALATRRGPREGLLPRTPAAAAAFSPATTTSTSRSR